MFGEALFSTVHGSKFKDSFDKLYFGHVWRKSNEKFGYDKLTPILWFIMVYEVHL